MLSLNKKIILVLIIVMVILFIITIYLLYDSINFTSKTDNNTKHQKEDFVAPYQSISAKSVYIKSPPGIPLNLFGVIIYDDKGDVINTNINNVSNSTPFAIENNKNYDGKYANRLAVFNLGRKLYALTTNIYLGENTLPQSYNSGWNNWSFEGGKYQKFMFVGKYNSNNKTDNNYNKTDDGKYFNWWQYTFPTNVNISAVEIWGRDEDYTNPDFNCCYNRTNGIQILLQNQNGNTIKQATFTLAETSKAYKLFSVSNDNNGDFKPPPDYRYITGRSIYLQSAPREALNLFGIIIYDKNGNSINTNNDNNIISSSKPIYTDARGSYNAVNINKLQTLNPGRTLENAMVHTPVFLNNDNINNISLNKDNMFNYKNNDWQWNKWTTDNSFIFAAKYNDFEQTDDSENYTWWQYTFPNNVNIAAVEIWGRNDTGIYNRTDGMKIIIKSSNNTPVGVATFTDAENNKAYKLFTVDNNDFTQPITITTPPITTPPITTQPSNASQQPITTQPNANQPQPNANQPPYATSPNYIYMGCYADNSPPNQLIPNILSNPRLGTNFVSSVDECYNLAQSENGRKGSNYNVFGLQLGGYCYASNDTINNPKYSTIGNGQDCGNILGGLKSNQVYSINNPVTTSPVTTSPATTPPITTIPSDCNSIGLQPSSSTNTIQSQCNNSKNCYYVNGSCYDQSRFTPVPPNGLTNNFSCQIGGAPKGNGYLLQCPNTDKSNYLFNNISQTSDCIQSDSTCNLITMSNPNLQTPTINNNSNPNPTVSPKLATVQYINGSFPQPLFLSNSTVQGLTDNFNNLSGNLFFTDINDNKMQVPYNIVPAINNIPSGKSTLLSTDSNLLSQIQNMNNSIRQNLNLITQS